MEDGASQSCRPEIGNPASGRPGRLMPESLREIFGRSDAQNHHFYNKVLLRTDHVFLANDDVDDGVGCGGTCGESGGDGHDVDR